MPASCSLRRIHAAFSRSFRSPLVVCLAWLVPGLVGREPWKNADVTAFGYMAELAQGRTQWLNPTLLGLGGSEIVTIKVTKR